MNDEFIKENLFLMIENYDDNIKDKKNPVDIDTERINIVEQFTKIFIEAFDEQLESEKTDIRSQVLEKIDDVRYEVENLI